MITMFLLAVLVMVTVVTSCIGGGYLISPAFECPLWGSIIIWTVVYSIFVWLVMFFISAYDSMED